MGSPILHTQFVPRLRVSLHVKQPSQLSGRFLANRMFSPELRGAGS